MQINHPDNVAGGARESDIRSGKRDGRCLLEGEEGAPNNYHLSYNQGGEGGTMWTTPRHRHNSEHFRHPLEGDYVMSPKVVIPAGWVAYVPESVYYGPQEQSPNLKMVLTHCGGPSGYGFPSHRQKREARKTLTAKGGTFKNGIYTYVDENGAHHNQDSFEALWEEIFGRRIVYPPPRFHDFVLMNPHSFSWIKDTENPGIARKMLGSFTERDTRVGFIRGDTNAAIPFGTENSPEAIFIKEGSLSFDGQVYGPLTAFGIKAAEAPVSLTVADECELWYVKFPEF